MKISPEYSPRDKVVLISGERWFVDRVSVDGNGTINYYVWDYKNNYSWITGYQIHEIEWERTIGFQININ